ncbi:MAG: protein-L-isoaspartate(D-aspartate) O-methyltransferase [Acidobacteria bacterium]|nr:protein-L-isoaspartate(D-aspartate) O-methyltransferase [Acidobacteriota bacterium]MCI0718934.1 protein-L-isoaspartate(D-aspartate) O-methyltransferase [Acidobacteriota bacterium]
MKNLLRGMQLATAFSLTTLAWSCAGTSATQKSFEQLRHAMVDEQVLRRGVEDPRVLDALRKVPRHLFVPAHLQRLAYEDHPLPIGLGQTISQPYIVALMTELARVKPNDTVLEIGTGSGYQAAVLSVLAKRIFTIEYLAELGESARQRLRELGYSNVEVRIGDGFRGWPERQPFGAILVTAASQEVPQPLIEQLRAGGRLVIPVGGQSEAQTLQVIEKDASGAVSRRNVIPVRFVPLVRPRDGVRK